MITEKINSMNIILAVAPALKPVSRILKLADNRQFSQTRRSALCASHVSRSAHSRRSGPETKAQEQFIVEKLTLSRNNIIWLELIQSTFGKEINKYAKNQDLEWVQNQDSLLRSRIRVSDHTLLFKHYNICFNNVGCLFYYYNIFNHSQKIWFNYNQLCIIQIERTQIFIFHFNICFKTPENTLDTLVFSRTSLQHQNTGKIPQKTTTLHQGI
ncbi:Hypothetical_protein [Hexamita inflata]|uniref:Hypothetical_protein n=1 Tax=Hexamita inflata TaxID=28002 RepID=A0AA86P912_9EUKA|nr:Hypothetical protein HINF_LOCUS22009 [Hexamita inflata]